MAGFAHRFQAINLPCFNVKSCVLNIIRQSLRRGCLIQVFRHLVGLMPWPICKEMYNWKIVIQEWLITMESIVCKAMDIMACRCHALPESNWFSRDHSTNIEILCPARDSDESEAQSSFTGLLA